MNKTQEHLNNISTDRPKSLGGQVHEDNRPKLPKDFLWGASTSAYQVEGNSRTQWTEWEVANADKKAATAKKRYLRYMKVPKHTWERIKTQAEDPENYINGPGVDHYNRYKEDFDILKSLNFNSFRFGVEWSRIEPVEGQWDQQAIAHYKKYIAELKKRGIEPIINIWHWTNPIWFEEKGAFKKRKNLKYFDRFVSKVADEFLDDIKYVIVINEPNNYSILSYLLGFWPPSKKNPISTVRVAYNLMLAQRKAYDIIKAKKPQVQVGTAQHTAYIEAVNSYNPVTRIFSAIANYVFQDWLFYRINNHQDFVGMNFYQVHHLTGIKPMDLKRTPKNDMGWYMEPRTIGKMIIRMHQKFGQEIIVTENGVADATDEYRKWWIQETLLGIEDAVAAGAKVKGYMYWSLLDNFEWAEGWWPRFGLVEVDRSNGMQRKIRPSAKWFATEIANRRDSARKD